MLHAATASPIGPLVSLAAEHPTVTGLVIAFGEVAVGLGTLLGLFTHIAALGGFLLALSLFLPPLTLSVSDFPVDLSDRASWSSGWAGLAGGEEQVVRAAVGDDVVNELVEAR
ncbi:hypothetical protein [Actinophytocola sp.]|uniref:hypothetical protein n=1 Tax=Actinophytocola sp. TaxID=1872138 RepID=UPI0039C8613E